LRTTISASGSERDSFPWALAGFLGAALAPTDAALSAQVINDRRVPMRLRRALNVESGLNDGIATPVVTFMLAVAASQLGLVVDSPSAEAGQALRELGLGIVAGLVLGIGGAGLITVAARHGWIGQGADVSPRWQSRSARSKQPR
jgi:NhaP-type Na+/H+ or K+/H+ antiporter